MARPAAGDVARRMRGWRPSRWAVVIAAAAVAVLGLIPGLARPSPALGLACLNNCSSLTVVLTQGSGTWQTTSSSYVPNNVINCTVTGGTMSGSCFHKYQNTYPPQNLTIYFLVTPAVQFKGCNSTTGTCSTSPQHGSLTFYADMSVTNWSFVGDPQDWTEIGASLGGTGSGTVGVEGFTCTTASSPCTFWTPGALSSVTYTATADAGSYFVSWGNNSCAGSTIPSCNVTNDYGEFGETATFNLVGGPTPAPTIQPTPSPTAGTRPTPTPQASGTAVPTAAASRSPGPSTTAVAGQTPGSAGGGPSAAPGQTVPSETSTPAPGSSDVAVASGSDQPGGGDQPTAAGPTNAPGDVSEVSVSGGDGGLTGPIIIAGGLVVAGLMVGVGIVFATRLRRPPTS